MIARCERFDVSECPPQCLHAGLHFVDEALDVRCVERAQLCYWLDDDRPARCREVETESPDEAA